MGGAEIASLFTRPDGTFAFARWRRPIAPVVFGVDDGTLVTVRGAIETVAAVAGHGLAETDPEQGANLIVFFIRDWGELLSLPDLDRLVEGLHPLVARLEAEGSNQYRHFRFEADGAIRACIVFVRMDRALAALPADTLALNLAARAILTWSGSAALVAEAGGRAVLAPGIAALLRAAYDPVLPPAAGDPSHALRLAARVAGAVQKSSG